MGDFLIGLNPVNCIPQACWITKVTTPANADWSKLTNAEFEVTTKINTPGTTNVQIRCFGENQPVVNFDQGLLITFKIVVGTLPICNTA